MIDTEPAVEEMRPMLSFLAELGIEAGKPFDPDERTTALLTEAARQGRDEMPVTAFASDRPDRIAWPVGPKATGSRPCRAGVGSATSASTAPIRPLIAGAPSR
ncbi:hypothetical protein ACFYM0_37900 [Streptomyces sp. NPDC006487]|uniref:hypothetical protein n=1 Tax=Streptomyces sp. NPDC006487 TaxID=3364748 RepID=UPI00368EB515